MADIKVLKVLADTDLYQEHSESSDSIKMASYKTANKELTDAKLANLIDGVDAQDEHHHDGRYFREDEFIDATTGITDASKPVKTDADGYIDPSLIQESDLAHDELAGVAASTAHAAFPLLVGGRDFTAIQKYDSHKSFSQDTEIVDKKYVDDLAASIVSGDNWLQAIDAVSLTDTGLTPVDGYRVLINGVGTDGFAGHDNAIAEYNASAWSFTDFASVPLGSTVRLIDTDKFYLKNTANWTRHAMESTQVEQNGPLFFSAEYELDLATKTNGGLKIDSAELAVDVDYLAGQGLANDGADKLEIDFSASYDDQKAIAAADLNSTANGKGASIIGIEDAAGKLVSDNVEDAIAELAQLAEDAGGTKYLAGTGGITKGQLVRVVGNNTVLPYADLTVNDYVLGMAMADAAQGTEVKIARVSKIITGALVGATAGTRYFWDGSAYVTAMPSASGANVYLAGIAKNATDLEVFVAHIKKNA